MKKIQNYLKEAFSFTQNEARGALVLLLVLIVFVLLMNLSDAFFTGNPPEITIEHIQRLEETTEVLKRTESKAYSNYNYTKEARKKFPFDPNTASVPTLISLGFPSYLAERIDKYRNKGGKFKKVEDLQKIYGLTPKLWREIAPFVQLSSPASSQKYPEKQEFTQIQSAQPTFTPFETNKVGTERTTSTKSKSIRFDLNAADTTQLKLLPGIGSGYAKRIIAYRDKLGGFLEVEQVSETYQLSELAIQSISEQCFVQKEVRKIALNKVDKITHPYLTYAQAHSLVSYRKQHGSYKNEQDLRAIKTLDENTIQRILPYLSFD